MGWFGFGGSDSPSSSAESSTTPVDLNAGMNFSVPGFDAPSTEPTPIPEHHSPFPAAPVLALDQLKSAGVNVSRQMTPYVQMDPSMFVSQQPQYIMPEGGVAGKGKFEFALGHIGWAVGGAFGVGCARGALGELLNPETRKMAGKPWVTRMVNATMKHGSGFAQPAGAIVFMYSALEIGLRSVRAEDELNGFGAGALTGAIYRSPHGLKASGIGALVGLGIATAWTLSSTDSRQRLSEMFNNH
ncbi:hypothetical protein CAEBREN_16508 [Caenorhabditis brenneri]|uniref:Uncharacterized protein n=1 Tax=Caenorhabditis brenneri TaxID=135651 RepID=G0NIG0_CAEBE|nr:hypothetical protein CAEBREN_16508 [Caenorhabditis brenneri]